MKDESLEVRIARLEAQQDVDRIEIKHVARVVQVQIGVILVLGFFVCVYLSRIYNLLEALLAAGGQ